MLLTFGRKAFELAIDRAHVARQCIERLSRLRELGGERLLILLAQRLPLHRCEFGSTECDASAAAMIRGLRAHCAHLELCFS